MPEQTFECFKRHTNLTLDITLGAFPKIRSDAQISFVLFIPLKKSTGKKGAFLFKNPGLVWRHIPGPANLRS